MLDIPNVSAARAVKGAIRRRVLENFILKLEVVGWLLVVRHLMCLRSMEAVV